VTVNEAGGRERKLLIWRYDRGQGFSSLRDTVLSERELTLFLDGEELTSGLLTEGDEERWALGHLATRGLIENREDVVEMHLSEKILSVRRTRALPGVRSREKVTLAPLPVTWRLSAETVAAAVKTLSEAPLYRSTGCVHVAALFSRDGERLSVAEDVGRHNAVDKVVGWAVEKAHPLEATFLTVSGRLPRDMVLKAALVRIPLVASVSAATEASIATAQRAGITLCGFVRGGRMNVYAIPERFVEWNAETPRKGPSEAGEAEDFPHFSSSSLC
jgi:FdhD protein